MTSADRRRTIAWHIARRPGGRVALAIHGHLRTITGEGYSGRARHGLRDMVDLETARTMAEHLSKVAEQLGNGEHVTGPAATRLIAAARAATARFGGIYLSPKDAAALLAEPAFQVHDNPHAFLTCNYDPAKALCDPERRNGRQPRHGQPSLDRCDAGCANIARTDTHIDQARHEAGNRQTFIANPLTPQPLRERHQQRLTALHRFSTGMNAPDPKKATNER